MKKLLLALFSATVILPAMATEQVAELKIPGMTCPVCPITIKHALNKVDGVLHVETSLADRVAVVTFDDKVTNLASLENATKEAGYPSKAKRENNSE